MQNPFQLWYSIWEKNHSKFKEYWSYIIWVFNPCLWVILPSERSGPEIWWHYTFYMPISLIRIQKETSTKIYTPFYFGFNNNIDHMRISGIDPSSLRVHVVNKLKTKQVRKQSEAKRDALRDPLNYNFNQFQIQNNLMLSKCYKSIEGERRTVLHVLIGIQTHLIIIF